MKTVQSHRKRLPVQRFLTDSEVTPVDLLYIRGASKRLMTVFPLSDW